jgi:hypothetical protein
MQRLAIALLAVLVALAALLPHAAALFEDEAGQMDWWDSPTQLILGTRLNGPDSAHQTGTRR